MSNTTGQLLTARRLAAAGYVAPIYVLRALRAGVEGGDAIAYARALARVENPGAPRRWRETAAHLLTKGHAR